MGGNPLEPRPTFMEKYMAEEEKSEETFKVNTGDDDKTIDVEQDFEKNRNSIMTAMQLGGVS